jgi:hypothetical protein
VVPRDEDPYIEEFLMDQDELDKFLERYEETAAFIVSIEFMG